MSRLLHQLIFIGYLHTIHCVIMRNNALMTKMVTQFQDKGNQYQITKPENGNVVEIMHNVLCKNFPSIPCNMITKDPTLRNLIEKSIQQIKYKKMKIDKTTSPPNNGLTLFPVINSEDLSNYLQESNTLYKENENEIQHKRKQIRNQQKDKSSEKKSKIKSNNNKKKPKNSFIQARKKIRKFYPHKIKYKDKNVNAEFVDYSGEKLSMSVELPEPVGVKRRHFTYRNADPPVWRIDYTKHGEPASVFSNYDPGLKGKMLSAKTGPNVIVDDNMMESNVRKDVLHPDVYIKRNFVRRSSADNGHTDNFE